MFIECIHFNLRQNIKSDEWITLGPWNSIMSFPLHFSSAHNEATFSLFIIWLHFIIVHYANSKTVSNQES